MTSNTIATEVLVRVSNLTRQIGETILLDDVSLSIQSGQCLGLTGESGSGKSSLLRSIAMLDPVDAGSVEGFAAMISGADVPSYRRKVAYVSQRPSMVAGTVEDNLRLPFELGSSSRVFNQKAAIDILESLGRTSSLLEQDANRLSGGEQQSVSLTRTLLAEPQILLLDEPTASLDPAATELVERVLLDWKNSEGSRAWIWTSHDANQIARVSSQVFRMRAGRLIHG